MRLMMTQSGPPRLAPHPLRVSAVSCRLLLSIPFVVRSPILHAVVVRCCCCPPSPSSSAAAVFRRHSHHRHSPVSAVSHHPLLSFPIAVRPSITHVLVICHLHHLPLPLSAVAIPPLGAALEFFPARYPKNSY
jgi:hypothetical protein